MGTVKINSFTFFLHNFSYKEPNFTSHTISVILMCENFEYDTLEYKGELAWLLTLH